MAEKTAPATDPKTFADTATKAVEDAVGKAQNQYLAMLSESQNLALDAYKSMFDGLAKLNLPVVPGMPSPAAMVKLPAQMIDGAFGFSAAVLESQRSFARKVFEVSPA
ncbi:MAG: hypothetical protein R2761_09055 [Acidimicrobiales bacterium]